MLFIYICTFAMVCPKHFILSNQDKKIISAMRNGVEDAGRHIDLGYSPSCMSSAARWGMRADLSVICAGVLLLCTPPFFFYRLLGELLLESELYHHQASLFMTPGRR